MPGRAGRSKGCINCQRRKVGCDRAKPSCGRCERLNEVCEGYASANFIAFEAPKAKEGALVRGSSPMDPRRPWTVVSYQVHPTKHVTRVNFAIAPTPSITAMSQDIFITYTRRFMLKGTDEHFPVFDLMDAAVPSNVLYNASLTALATSYFGLTQGRNDLVQKGTKLYGKILKDVNHALVVKGKVASADLLSSIVCLGMFEFMHPTGDDSWTFHFNGLSQLFEMWGPEACSVSPIQDYFEHCRPIMIFASLKDGKPTFLARKEWKTIPWQNHRRDLADYLFDTMADLPSYRCVQERLEAMSEDDPRKEPLRTSHISNMRASIAELDDWLARFHERHGECRTEVPCAFPPVNSVGQQLSWSSNFHYKNLDIANCICFHDGTRVFLLRLLIGALPKSISPEESSIPVDREAMRTTALDICRSADFHLMHFQDAAGGFFLLFPMVMALRTFIKLEMWPEVKWAQDQFLVIASRNKVAWQVAGQYR